MVAEPRIMRRRAKQPFEESKDLRKKSLTVHGTREPGLGNTTNVRAHGEVEGRRT
jgi:hypothetical protein